MTNWSAEHRIAEPKPTLTSLEHEPVKPEHVSESVQFESFPSESDSKLESSLGSSLEDPEVSFDVTMENNSTFVNKEQNSNYPYSIYCQCLPSKNDINEINEKIKENITIGKENETTYIASHCVNKEQVIECIRRYPDCFMWKPSDMTGVDPPVVVHKIATYPEAKPVKQKLRRVKPEWSLKIKEEIAKQLDDGFIEPITYTTWLANMVPVPKKDGKIRVCVDYRDLNKACPKDDFPLPHIDLLIDRMAGHEMVSMTDLAVGYNHILMHPPDKAKTAFTTEWGNYCYTVMLFGLKNAGATYQRIVSQALRKWKIREELLVPYLERLHEIVNQFEEL